MIAAAAALLAAGARASELNLNSPDLGMPARHTGQDVAIGEIQALPEDARRELFDLYQRYIAEVGRRRDEQHWRHGLLSGEIVEHPDEAVLPARQLEEAVAKREAEVTLLEDQVKRDKLADLENGPPPPRERVLQDWRETEPAPKPKASEAAAALKAKNKELRRAKRALSRSKGLALDWSDDVWAELQKAQAENWTISDQTRSAGPRHSAAVACAPADKPAVCLVFDPWKTGEPDVYEFLTWDQGSFDGRIAPEFFLHHLPDRS